MRYIGFALLAVLVIGGTAWGWSNYSFRTSEAPVLVDGQVSQPTVADTQESQASDVLTREGGEPLRVVFAGDSLTYGLYASNEDAGYRALTVEALEESGPVKWSRGGQVGNRVQTVAETIKFPSKTDLIVLALGTNDAFKTDPAVMADQYAALTRDARDSAPDAAIVCLGVWGNADAGRNWDPPIEDGCASVNGTFVPLSDLFEDASNRGPAGRDAFGGVSDDFHPNDQGYAAIAERLLGALDVA